MPTPTHDSVARRAQDLWRTYGCPAGRDLEIWLEAERQLVTADGESAAGSTPFTRRVRADLASESAVEFQISPAIPEEEAIRAALQKTPAHAPARQ